MKYFSVIVGMLSICLVLTGCYEREDISDKAQREATSKMLSEAHKQVGMPDITSFEEKRLARDILELRDKSVPTYTYIINMHGDLIFLGESIGYGLPYSVQFSNPIKPTAVDLPGIGHKYTELPQAEPNGLFMPEGLSATWILLKDPSSDEVKPVYVESEITVSPFPLHHVNKVNSE